MRLSLAPLLILFLLALTSCGADSTSAGESTPFPTAKFHPPEGTTPPPSVRQNPTHVPAGTPTPLPGPFSCRVSAQTPISTSEPLQNIVIFARDAVIPSPYSNDLSHFSQLWAISADGRRIGPLTADDQSAAVLSRPGPPASLLLLAPDDLFLAGDQIQVIALPNQCRPPAGEAPNWRPCSDFAFSPDGRHAAFFWGKYTCAGREGVIAIDLLTGETRSWNSIGVRWFEFLPDGRIIIANGDCEGGEYISTWNVETGQTRFLGPKRGPLVWNAAHTAFATEFVPLPCDDEEFERVLWVYNLLTDQVTQHIEGENGDSVWSPEGDHLLYHHRAVTKTWDQAVLCPITITYGPREIHVIDVASGESRRLVGDLEYDYHLDQDVRGDWLSLHRIHYRNWVCSTLGRCDSACLDGRPDCPEQAEHVALNWRTGELLPWEQAPIPDPTPTPSPPEPPPVLPWDQTWRESPSTLTPAAGTASTPDPTAAACGACRPRGSLCIGSSRDTISFTFRPPHLRRQHSRRADDPVDGRRQR